MNSSEKMPKNILMKVSHFWKNIGLLAKCHDKILSNSQNVPFGSRSAWQQSTLSYLKRNSFKKKNILCVPRRRPFTEGRRFLGPRPYHKNYKNAAGFFGEFLNRLS